MLAFTAVADDRPQGDLAFSLPGAISNSADVPLVVTVQYLRAIAASLVVLHHALNIPALAPYYVSPFGTYGVDLFFVISGYIMWATTANRRRSPLRFWAARIMRVAPLYWIFTSLFLAAALVLPSALFTAALDPSHVVKSYLFIPAEHPRLGNISPVYTLGWTLNYEMFFYFIFGLCLLIPYGPARLMVLVGALALLVSVGWLTELRGAATKTYTSPILLEFAAGAVLAWFAPRLNGARPAIGWALLGGAVIWLIVAYSRTTLPSLISAHAFPAVGMLAGALVLEPLARRRANPLGLFLGDASYSIYLAHPFGQRIWYFALDKSIGVASLTLGAIFVVTAVFVGVASGAVSYLLLEKPILRTGKKLRRYQGRGLRDFWAPVAKARSCSNKAANEPNQGHKAPLSATPTLFVISR